MMQHSYTVRDKTVPVRPGAINASLVAAYGPEIGADDGTRYRWVCTCGKRGRWFADPYRAKRAGESHLIAVYGEW